MKVFYFNKRAYIFDPSYWIIFPRWVIKLTLREEIGFKIDYLDSNRWNDHDALDIWVLGVTVTNWNNIKGGLLLHPEKKGVFSTASLFQEMRNLCWGDREQNQKPKPWIGQKCHHLLCIMKGQISSRVIITFTRGI